MKEYFTVGKLALFIIWLFGIVNFVVVRSNTTSILDDDISIYGIGAYIYFALCLFMVFVLLVAFIVETWDKKI